MIVTRLRWLAALGISLSLSSVLPAQQTVVWRAAASQPTGPIATIGRPIPIAKPTRIVRAQAPDSVAPPEGGFSRMPPPPTADPLLTETIPSIPGGEAGFTTPVGADSSLPLNEPTVGTAPPQPAPAALTPHIVDAPPDDVPPPPASPFPSGGTEIAPGISTDHPVAPGFWERCRDMISLGDRGSTHGRCAFQSDTCFPGLISPITMPFYFEDPRALTEIRPIFMFQGIPDSNPFTNGGSAMWFGTQLRLAVTDRLSFVVNELGFLSINPDTAIPPFKNATGFAELKLGPKYTFLRNTDTGTVSAFGVTFEIPTGAKSVFQDTGSLSIDPYFSIGQTFGLGSGWGSLNLLGNTGYSFSVDNQRAEFYHLSFHIDYNIANINTVYPLFELNWIHYTNTPNSRPFNFEGAYLINFGSANLTNKDWLALAGGLRFRFTDNVYAGMAAEFPVLKEKGFADYRLIFDVIFRF